MKTLRAVLEKVLEEQKLKKRHSGSARKGSSSAKKVKVSGNEDAEGEGDEEEEEHTHHQVEEQ
jgi:hypothetical protein